MMSVFTARDYLDRTAEEINESLQENGQTVIADVAKTFNLPSEFILSVRSTKIHLEPVTTLRLISV